MGTLCGFVHPGLFFIVMGPLHTRHGFAVPPSPSRRGPFSFSQGARRAGADLCPILPRNCIGLYWTVLNCIVLYWLDLLRLLDLLGLLSLTISAGMDSRIKASIIPAWFILISLKVDFYQLYYTVKVQKSQLRRQTKIRVFCSDEWSGPHPRVGGDAHIAPRPDGRDWSVSTYRSVLEPSGR